MIEPREAARLAQISRAAASHAPPDISNHQPTSHAIPRSRRSAWDRTSHATRGTARPMLRVGPHVPALRVAHVVRPDC